MSDSGWSISSVTYHKRYRGFVVFVARLWVTDRWRWLVYHDGVKVSEGDGYETMAAAKRAGLGEADERACGHEQLIRLSAEKHKAAGLHIDDGQI